MTDIESVAVVDGLMAQGTNGPRLIGSRCRGCGSIYFPEARACRNPGCESPDLERMLLSNLGTLHSYTIQYYPPPAPFRMDDWAPYALGVVALNDQVHVMGMLTGIEFDDLEIGIAMELVSEALYTDAERGLVMTHKFAPARPANTP